MILFLFFCSGATALVYEVLWSKYLSLMLGSTVQAQTIVLAVFMGGLALGNFLFGRRSAGIRGPLLAYGYIEVAIGLYAAAFDWLFRGAEALFVLLGTPVANHSFLLLCLKALLSVGLLLPPTILMGGTLPLLAAWLQRAIADAGRLSARFYAINTLGAVCGAGLAGFYLVRNLGLVATLLVTGLVNVLIGAIAIGLARQGSVPQDLNTSSVKHPPHAAPIPLARACVLVGVTGALAMSLEILAARGLALIFGSSLQAFALVLMAFILGIGLGSTIIASPRLKGGNDQARAVFLLIVAAAWVAALVYRMESWVEFYRWSKTGLARTEVGYLYHQFLTSVTALAVLGVPAALIGAVLPLMIRAVSTGSLGSRVGRLLTWNTLGAVVGVLLTGFVVMPALGLRNAFAAVVIGLAVLALIAAWSGTPRWWKVGAAIPAVLAAALLFSDDQKWKIVFNSGMFRNRDLTYEPGLMEERAKAIELLYYRDAADATVSVERVNASGTLSLRINGKSDASSGSDYSTQVLCAHLPMMMRPASQDVFLLGLGSGITAGAILAHPIERLVVAENCAPVIEAAALFAAYNNGILNDSRARIIQDDGRSVLKLSPQQYDVVISVPSNPWTAGIGSVFSQEYYKIAASRLKPGGLMAQWFQVYEMNNDIVVLVIRTFATVFPYFEIWDAGSGDIILLGGNKPWTSTPEVYEQVFARKTVQQQLNAIGLAKPGEVWARQLASQRTAFAIPGDGPVQSDFFPTLEYEAPEAFFIGDRASLLLAFDERTVQWPLMTQSKQAALGLLDDAALKRIFAPYTSVNSELLEFLAWRFDGYPPTKSLRSVSMPSIFRSTNAPLPSSTAPDSEPLKLLDVAIDRLRFRTAEPDQLLSEVTAVLKGMEKELAIQHLEAFLYCLRTAARHNLAVRNYEGIRKLLSIGLAASPGDLQLQYLLRILDQEESGLTGKSAG